MIDFFFLVPIAIGLGLAGLASFMWTLKNGQYDDLEGAAERILFEGNEGPLPEKRRSDGPLHPGRHQDDQRGHGPLEHIWRPLPSRRCAGLRELSGAASQGRVG